MKRYTKSNFFKHTFCDFIKVENSFFDENKTHFKSATGSQYYFTEDGVYRYSNHWGRVANCKWRLVSESRVKNQEYHVGYTKWTHFYPLNESEKQFYISVDYDKKRVSFHHKNTHPKAFLFFASTAQKRIVEIQKILYHDNWAKYFNEDIEVLRKQIVYQLVNSNKTLQEIKLEFH